MTRQNRLLAITLSIALCGCATGGVSTGSADVAATDQPFTVEGLIRAPLGGPAAADKIIDELKTRFGLQPLSTGEFSKRGPFKLDDGYVLSSITVSPTTRDIDVGLNESPCYPPTEVATAAGATPSEVTQDAHGEDRGKTYNAQQNGMRVRFTTTPLSYRCVTSIHVRKE